MPHRGNRRASFIEALAAVIARRTATGTALARRTVRTRRWAYSWPILIPDRQVRRAATLGASLIELLVMVGVFAVLVLTVLPQLIVPVQIPLGQTAREVAADLGLARQLAIGTRANYVVIFSPAAGPFTSYTVQPQSGVPGPDFPKTFPTVVSVTGTQQITFAPDGSASPSATLTFTDGAAIAQVQVLAATGFVQETGP